MQHEVHGGLDATWRDEDRSLFELPPLLHGKQVILDTAGQVELFQKRPGA